MTPEEQRLLSDLSLTSNLEAAFDQMAVDTQTNLLSQAGSEVKQAQS
jgi:hypothetical protein